MAMTDRDTRSLVKDFNSQQQDVPPKYEQHYDNVYTGYSQAAPPMAAYPQAAPVTQHHNMVVVTQPGMVTNVHQMPRPDTTCAVLFSCCVFWCCCWPLGLAAFIVAMGVSSAPDTTSARSQVRTSYILSGVGMAIGVISIIIAIIYFAAVMSTVKEEDDYDYSNGY